jgi:hypothetical protein
MKNINKINKIDLKIKDNSLIVLFVILISDLLYLNHVNIMDFVTNVINSLNKQAVRCVNQK